MWSWQDETFVLSWSHGHEAVFVQQWAAVLYPSDLVVYVLHSRHQTVHPDAVFVCDLFRMAHGWFRGVEIEFFPSS